MLILFYAFCFFTALSALMIVFTNNVLYAAFLILLTFVGIAGIYVFLGADFLAVTQIVVYVGGVLVLLLFGIMLTNNQAIVSNQKTIYLQPQTANRNLFLGAIVGFALFFTLAFTILSIDFESIEWISKANSKGELLKDSSIPILGVNLMTYYILPFELLAILLLVALIGSTLIAGKK